MKLGEIKAAIRSTKGSPAVSIQFTGGSSPVTIALMKGPLMEALDAAYPGGKAVETGLVFEQSGDDNLLRPESGATYTAAPAPAPLLDIMTLPSPTAATVLLDLDETPSAPISTTALLLDL